MRAHIIQNNIVINTIEVESLDFMPGLIDAENGGSVGDAYIDGEFVKPVQPAAQIVQAKVAAIKADRDRRVQTGGYKVGTKWYHSDTFSRTQQMGLVMMGANMPTGIQWKSMDGSFVAMTPTLAGQIFGAAAANDSAIFTAAETHIAAVTAAADPAAYDFSQGWPPVFA
jgi:hypothetical protein